MAKFDESKVINALHTEKAEVGKKYYFADSLLNLKERIENNSESNIGILEKINLGFRSFSDGDYSWEFLYPYEEPPKQRMTNVQFMEWLAKGNGVYKSEGGYVHTYLFELEELLDEEVDKGLLIKSWDSEEWIEPTVDIYERDCKGKENV